MFSSPVRKGVMKVMCAYVLSIHCLKCLTWYSYDDTGFYLRVVDYDYTKGFILVNVTLVRLFSCLVITAHRGGVTTCTFDRITPLFSSLASYTYLDP